MGYTFHGILQAKILEWVAFPFSRESSQLRDWTRVSCIVGRLFTSWAVREALKWTKEMNNLKQLGYEIFGKVSNYSGHYIPLFISRDECSSQQMSHFRFTFQSLINNEVKNLSYV